MDIPMEFGVDFKTGQMTGGKVKGAKAVAVWAWNALLYPRYRYELASWQYGSELTTMIGRAMDEEEARIQAEAAIRDALLPNPYIRDVTDLDCTLSNDHLTVSFTIVTPFGKEALTDVTL